MEMPPDEDKTPAQPAGDPSEASPAETPEGATPSAGQTRRPSADEALAEMRRSLREEEKQEKTGFRAGLMRLMQKLFGRRAKTPEEGPSVASEEGLQVLDIPARLDMPEAAKQVRPPRPAEPPKESAPPAEVVHTPPPESQPAEFGALVRSKLTEAFETKEEIQPPASGHSILASIRPEVPEAEPDTSSFRQEALEDYVLTPEEPEEEGRKSLVRSVRRSWRDMRPLERRLLTGALLIVGVAMLIGGGFLVWQFRPAPTATPTPTFSTAPYPITVSLPGGWVFQLRTGFVQNGKWSPLGAEWLQGTEICRWVSLPWSVQLEAVIRTLKTDDEIKLTMSNYDSLVYKVKSIEQVPSGQLADLAPSTPSLLLILSKKDSDIRWVVTALP